MALDGVTLNHLVREIEPKLIGSRIDKINQPEKEEVHLLLRSPGQSYRLLFNTSATSARFNLTNESKKNPTSPPMFCMILRKHLEGGKILSIKQLALERIIIFTIQNYNEYGDLATLDLYLEIMGKHSNLILVDPKNNTILDGLKRYSHSVSRHREVLPGRTYIAPPSQNKVDPIALEDDWRPHLFQGELSSKVTDLLVKYFSGISPELSREIVIRAGLDLDTRLEQCGDIDLSRVFQTYSLLANPENLETIEPCLYYQSGSKSNQLNLSGVPLAFSFLPYQQYQGLPYKVLPTLNEAIELFYSLKASNSNLEAKRGSLRKFIQEQYRHLEKKINIYDDTIAKAKKGLNYQRWGELLMANLYRIEPRATEIVVEDYNEENLPQVTIPLDPQLSAIDNSQRYYKLYNKAKATIQKTEPLKIDALAELDYLESVLLSLEQATTEQEIDEIHKELVEEKYIAGKQKDKNTKSKKGAKGNKKSANKREVPKPRIFISSQNRPILVGKNNQQNDWLTLKRGRPHDLWLHTKNIPGSHVLIPLKEGEEYPDDATLEEAATLAVYFSQARDSSSVPVDYTHVKNVKKPKGAKPGMVIYLSNRTVFITPQHDVIEGLLARETEEMP